MDAENLGKKIGKGLGVKKSASGPTRRSRGWKEAPRRTRKKTQEEKDRMHTVLKKKQDKKTRQRYNCLETEVPLE